MNHMVFSTDHYNSIFVDRVTYKHRNWQFHGILVIPILVIQISLFSPHMRKVTVSA